MKSETIRRQPPFLIRVIRILMGVIVSLTAVWIVLLYVPPIRLSVLHLVGRSECDYEQSIKAYEWNQRLAQRTREMQAGSSRVEVDGGKERWKTPRGEYWFSGAMPELFPFVLAEMDLDVYGARRAISQGYIVLDCGADFGSFTRLALNRGASRVVAIEISPAKQECLRRTFHKEIAEGRVVVYPKGVWNKDDRLELRGDSVVFNRDPVKIPVRVTTIDKIVDELGLSRIDVIKLDIEGAEANAIRGASATLKQHRPTLLIASEHKPDDVSALLPLAKSSVPTYTAELDNCQDLGNQVRALTLRLVSR